MTDSEGRYSLRERLCCPLARLLGGLAVQLFSPNQFKYENEQQANSARAVAGALNAALARPPTIRSKSGCSPVASEAPKRSNIFRRAWAMEHPIKRVCDDVCAGLTSPLAIPELGTAYPIKIGTTHVGSIVFNPDTFR